MRWFSRNHTGTPKGVGQVVVRRTAAWLLALLLAGASASARERVFTVTAYCHCARCCGPGSPKPTASGAWPKVGVTIAGPRAIKFGTRLHLEGIGERIVQDRLPRRYDDRLDIFMASHEEAKRFGIRQIRVR